jgi:hypothetical protein
MQNRLKPVPTKVGWEARMWSGLRELFGGLSEKGRFWLAVVVILALLAVFVTMTVTGVETTTLFAPLWALLGG